MISVETDWQSRMMVKAGLYDMEKEKYSKSLEVHGDDRFLYPTSRILVNGIDLTAIWDTGAMLTTMGKNAKGRISLEEPVSLGTAHGVSEQRFPVTRHRVTLTLPDGFVIPNFLIQWVEGFDSPYTEILIGMDIISRGKFEVFKDENDVTSFRFSYNEEDMLSGDLDWQSELE